VAAQPSPCQPTNPPRHSTEATVPGTFDDEAGRDAHLNGKIAKALMANASELFSNELKIEKMVILTKK
jgi:quinol monooxygenase YgiN